MKLGKQIIYLNGLGVNSGIWEGLIRASAHTDLIHVPIDYLTLDQSNRPGTIAGVAWGIRQFLQRSVIYPAMILGHSFGALVAMSMAKWYPKATVLLLNPIGLQSYSAKEKDWLRKVYSTEFLNVMGKQGAYQSFKAMFYKYQAQMYDKYWKRIAKEFSNEKNAVMSSLIFDALRGEVKAVTRELTNRLHVVFGEYDHLSPFTLLNKMLSHQELMKSAFDSNSNMVSWELLHNTGHYSFLEQEAETSRIMTQLMQDENS